MSETIGILPAGNLGRLSQMFCVKKMNDAGVSKTIVYTRFYSSGVGSDYRVSSEKQLIEKLKEFPRDAAVVVSSNPKMYVSMMKDGAPAGGYATVYRGSSSPSVEGASMDLVVKALGGSAGIVLTVETMLVALSASSDPVDVPHESYSRAWKNDGRPARQSGWLHDVEYEMKDGIPAVLPVVFLTHNRTAVACHCLAALCRNLKYSGRIHFCICDDRSEPGHVEALENVLSENGVSDYSVCRTTSERWGLGASMNNGLKSAFSVSPVALTTEDDFLLSRVFDITGNVMVAMDDDVAGIRLAHVNVSRGRNGTTCTAVKKSARDGYWQVFGGNKRSLAEHYTFNNQVMLRNRRVYDFLGQYLECARAESAETDMCRRYSVAFNDGKGGSYVVLYPSSLPLDTLENGLFNHIGVSTMNHGHRVPTKYMWMNDKESDMKLRSDALSSQGAKSTDHGSCDVHGKFRFHIITPFYNCSSLLSRCLSCVASQTIDKRSVTMTVVDDASDPDEALEAFRLCSAYDFVSYMRSDDRVNTGGAKNIGLLRDVDFDYVVFLDADDVFFDENCLSKLDAELREKGDPDVMLCGFVFGDSGSGRMFSATSPEGMSNSNCIAPWIRVSKKCKAGLFNERRRIASDVTHYLRQLDNVSTVASSSFPLIRYTKDNPESAWASSAVNFSKDVMIARFLLMSDILSERFKHAYTRKAALRQMKYEYNVSLRDVMNHVDESTFE